MNKITVVYLVVALMILACAISIGVATASGVSGSRVGIGSTGVVKGETVGPCSQTILKEPFVPCGNKE